MNSKRIALLVVDDDDVAAMAVQRAIARAGLENPVDYARDGVEALDWLRAPERFSKPCVLLLDLNMPRMTGVELLEQMRADELLRHLPVFMLTTSDAPQDILNAFALNVAGYIQKEDAYRSIQGAVSFLKTYLETMTFPEYFCVKV